MKVRLYVHWWYSDRLYDCDNSKRKTLWVVIMVWMVAM